MLLSLTETHTEKSRRERTRAHSFEWLVTPPTALYPLFPHTEPHTAPSEDSAQQSQQTLMGLNSHLLLAYCCVTWDQGCCDHRENGHFLFEPSGLPWPQIPNFWGKKRHGKERGPRRRLETVHSQAAPFLQAAFLGACDGTPRAHWAFSRSPELPV